MADPRRELEEALETAMLHVADLAYDLVGDERGVEPDAAVSLVSALAAVRWAQNATAKMQKEAASG